MSLRSLIQGQPDTFFPETPPQKVYCGPVVGKVIVRGDGSVELTKGQLIIYTGYEVKNNLSPANVTPLSDGTFLVNVRK